MNQAFREINFDFFVPKKIKTPPLFIQNLGLYQKNQLWILRDDLFPFYFGGNKARKAVFYKDFFLKQNIDCVMTYGTAQSNHARVIALLAAELGIDSYLVCPESDQEYRFNSKLRNISHMQIIECSIAEVKKTIDEKMQELYKQYVNPYFIPGGGHDVYGTTAFVDLMFQIYNWEKQNRIHFEEIYFASGTGGTQAGLLLGEGFIQKQTAGQVMHQIKGISIARKKERGIISIEEAIIEFFERYKISCEISKIEFLDRYIGEGYGYISMEIKQLIQEFLKNYQIPLDPTYTGKAFWGMTEELKKQKIQKQNILFIHTGGTPLFYDYLNQ